MSVVFGSSDLTFSQIAIAALKTVADVSVDVSKEISNPSDFKSHGLVYLIELDKYSQG